MNRIDEIKKRVKKTKEANSLPPVTSLNVSITVEEMEYLLSLNEHLTEALRKIAVPMPGSRDNELVLYYERIAKEALEGSE